MSVSAVVLGRSGRRWSATEIDISRCETVDDVTDAVSDTSGQVRLLVVEQNDEYAVLARLDEGEDELRIFLTNGHAADEYPVAAMFAEGLDEVGGDELGDDEDAPYAHDAAPFGDPGVVADLGVSAAELLEMCAHEGTLPVDLIAAVCERAGCADVFEMVTA